MKPATKRGKTASAVIPTLSSLATAILFLAAIPAPGAANSLVFQIGAPDGSYQEFALAGNNLGYEKQFPRDVDFGIGKSVAARDWPYIQPGPADAWAGKRAHTFRIHFPLAAAGSNYYRLVLDLVSTHPSDAPRLSIDINGEKLDRKLPAGSGEEALTNSWFGKRCSVEQLTPPDVFHAGDNVIAITDVEGSWLLYDDVRLEGGISPPVEKLTLQATPLPFLRQTTNGWDRGVRFSVNNLLGGHLMAQVLWKTAVRSGSQSLRLPLGTSDQLIAVPDAGALELTLRAGAVERRAAMAMKPAKKWRVYVVPSAHTDIGYTDLQDRVMTRHAENGLQELDWLRQYPFLKWNSETYWQLDALLRLHPEKTDEVFQRLRERRWGLSGSYANLLTGLCSHEALNRYALDSKKLARRGGFDVNSMILDDVPSAVGSLPTVLAQSGIRYFIEGSNKFRAPGVGDGLKNPFYWEGPDGSRVLSYISYNPGYNVGSRLFPSVPRLIEQLPAYLARFDSTNYPYDAVVVNGTYGDNAPVKAWLPEVVQAWNAQWDYPKLIPALPADFLGYLEQNYSNALPVVRTDFGCWWEDGAASTARETALARRTEERTVTAETLHSLAVVLAGTAYPKNTFDDVWRKIFLYDEHSWGASGSVTHPADEQTIRQWETKRSFAITADAESRDLLASGMDQLAGLAPPADLVVFNSLAWTRDAVVTTRQTGALTDLESGRPVPAQALPEGGSCFIARDLPSIGYRAFRSVPPGQSQPQPDAVRIDGDQMENEFYRVRLDPKTGGIQSLYDKELGRELVDGGSDYPLGELIYATGGQTMGGDRPDAPPLTLTYHQPQCTGVRSVNGPVYGELTAEATVSNFPAITVRVRLYHGLKRMDLTYELDKTATLDKEAAYVSFPFAIDTEKGGCWVEYPDAVIAPGPDQHVSACQDWYAVQRWLAVSDGEATVELSPLDTPLVTFGAMSGHVVGMAWPREHPRNRGHVFAYVMNNYWHTNYKAEQGGRVALRFSLTSSAGAFSQAAAVVRGWNMFCEPVAGPGKSRGPAGAPPAQSLLGVSPAGLPLTAFKAAEDGNGFVLRFCDLSGQATSATLTLPRAVDAVFNSDLVEAGTNALNERGKQIAVPVRPFGPLTLVAHFNSAAPLSSN